ncbi:MAG: hypothetical protein ABIG63_20245 [Chloroflexota bacterium]
MFVGGLEVFVGGLEVFVGGFGVFVGGFGVFVGGLGVFVGGLGVFGCGLGVFVSGLGVFVGWGTFVEPDVLVGLGVCVTARVFVKLGVSVITVVCGVTVINGDVVPVRVGGDVAVAVADLPGCVDVAVEADAVGDSGEGVSRTSLLCLLIISKSDSAARIIPQSSSCRKAIRSML